MNLILGVKFKEVGKIYYFFYSQDDISKGDFVIAETMRGIECGKVVIVKYDDSISTYSESSEKILRKATPQDLVSLETKQLEEKYAEKVCKEKISQHKLKMKLIDVEYTFNRGKLIFYFTSESRVDFRSLVKDLAYIFKVRIELRQVGTRDEAKILGGLGICGKPVCCSAFLVDFQNVSVKMAKDQGVSLSPVKLSGACGRLKCCLSYEEDAYLDLLEKTPKIGAVVDTPEGRGIIVSRIPISSTVKVQIEDGAGNSRIKAFKQNEISVIYEGCE